MGFDGVGRKIQLVSDPLVPHAAGSIEVNQIHGFVCHGRLLPWKCREEVSLPAGVWIILRSSEP